MQRNETVSTLTMHNAFICLSIGLGFQRFKLLFIQYGWLLPIRHTKHGFLNKKNSILTFIFNKKVSLIKTDLLYQNKIIKTKNKTLDHKLIKTKLSHIHKVEYLHFINIKIIQQKDCRDYFQNNVWLQSQISIVFFCWKTTI